MLEMSIFDRSLPIHLGSQLSAQYGESDHEYHQARQTPQPRSQVEMSRAMSSGTHPQQSGMLHQTLVLFPGGSKLFPRAPVLLPHTPGQFRQGSVLFSQILSQFPHALGKQE